MKQSRIAFELSGGDEGAWPHIKEKALQIISDADEDTTAPEAAADIYRLIREFTGVANPYRERKEKSAEGAEAIYPHIREKTRRSVDELRAIIKAMAVGNVIDFGVPGNYFTPETIMKEFDELEFSIDDYEALKSRLPLAKKLLFVADNTGEIVFDRLFLEWAKDNLKCDVFFAVRGGYIINDATREDAIAHGIDEFAHIIDTGSAVPGAALSLASREFREMFADADLIISKGQGNFEVLEGIDRPIFFILKAKCNAVADYLGVEIGSLILKENRK